MLAEVIKTRLAFRNIYQKAKNKGDLNIFLMCSMNNWEKVLPHALSVFGNVSVFSWQSTGFFKRYQDWTKWRNRLNEQMLKTFANVCAEKPVDILIGYLSDFNTKAETLATIGGKGVILLNMNWDDKLYFAGSVRRQPCSVVGIVSFFDLNLTNAPGSCLKYFTQGGLAKFWPEAADPEIHHPYNVPFEFDISFVGQCYGRRPYFINKLINHGIKVNCFGKGWGKGTLSNEEMIKIYSKSRINLGFAGVGYSHKLMCLKGRDFEIPMSGGLYLTQDNPELSMVYEVGKEILTYNNEQDCLAKIKWLIAHPEEAEKIRQAGRKRALTEHTWEKRFSEIFKLVGILNTFPESASG
jgi:hypothetical protein